MCFLRLNDSLHCCRHAMYKVQTQLLANFGAPHSFYSSSEVVRTFRVFLSHFDLEETPQVFNRIHVPWWVDTAPPQFLRTGAVPLWAVEGRTPVRRNCGGAVSTHQGTWIPLKTCGVSSRSKWLKENTKSPDDLLAAIKTVWCTEVSQELCLNLVHSMPARMQAVLSLSRRERPLNIKPEICTVLCIFCLSCCLC